MEYKEYLQTDHWLKKRQDIIDWWGGKCCICNSEEKLEVHHRNYDNLWGELLSDLVVLCHPCHELFHLRMDTAFYTPAPWELEHPDKQVKYTVREMLERRLLSALLSNPVFLNLVLENRICFTSPGRQELARVIQAETLKEGDSVFDLEDFSEKIQDQEAKDLVAFAMLKKECPPDLHAAISGCIKKIKKLEGRIENEKFKEKMRAEINRILSDTNLDSKAKAVKILEIRKTYNKAEWVGI